MVTQAARRFLLMFPYNNSKLNAHNSTYSFSNLIKIYSHLNLHFYDRLTNTPSTPIIKITHWLRNKRKRYHCIKINSDGDIQSNQRHISDPQYTFICYRKPPIWQINFKQQSNSSWTKIRNSSIYIKRRINIAESKRSLALLDCNNSDDDVPIPTFHIEQKRVIHSSIGLLRTLEVKNPSRT